MKSRKRTPRRFRPGAPDQLEGRRVPAQFNILPNPFAAGVANGGSGFDVRFNPALVVTPATTPGVVAVPVVTSPYYYNGFGYTPGLATTPSLTPFGTIFGTGAVPTTVATNPFGVGFGTTGVAVPGAYFPVLVQPAGGLAYYVASPIVVNTGMPPASFSGGTAFGSPFITGGTMTGLGGLSGVGTTGAGTSGSLLANTPSGFNFFSPAGTGLNSGFILNNGFLPTTPGTGTVAGGLNTGLTNGVGLGSTVPTFVNTGSLNLGVAPFAGGVNTGFTTNPFISPTGFGTGFTTSPFVTPFGPTGVFGTGIV